MSEDVPDRAPLPRSIIDAAPVTADIAGHLSSIYEYLTTLEGQLRDAERAGSIRTAMAFVALRRLKDKFQQVIGDGGKFSLLFEQYKNVVVPASFERDGITHVPLAEGYRVGVSINTRASIRADKREEAMEWLRADPHLRDLIIETVNASTLSSTAKHLSEEENRDLPVELFNVALVPTTSVTTTETTTASKTRKRR